VKQGFQGVISHPAAGVDKWGGTQPPDRAAINTLLLVITIVRAGCYCNSESLPDKGPPTRPFGVLEIVQREYPKGGFTFSYHLICLLLLHDDNGNFTIENNPTEFLKIKFLNQSYGHELRCVELHKNKMAAEITLYYNFKRTTEDANVTSEFFEDVAKLKHFGTTLTNQNRIHEEIKGTLNSGQACCNTAHNPLSFRLTTTKVMIKIHKTIILHGAWSLTLIEEHRLRVFQDRALRGTCEPESGEITEGGTNFVMKSFIFSNLHSVDYY
jgi:hypothetical protein